MRKLSVAVDLDGVVIDQLPLWLFQYNAIYNDNLTMEEFAGTWEVADNVRSDVGYKVFDILKEPWFYEEALAIDGAIAGLNFLVDHPNINPYIVSAFMGSSEQVYGKCRWIERYVRDFPVDNIWFGHDKYLLDVDVLIDDSEKNIANFIRNETDRCGILFSAPHNSAAAICDFYVEDWDAVKEAITRIL